MDCDRQPAEDCGITREELIQVLQTSLDEETELLRTYTITSERIHDNEVLRERLVNFAQGNAKRTRQLIDELNSLQPGE